MTDVQHPRRHWTGLSLATMLLWLWCAAVMAGLLAMAIYHGASLAAMAAGLVLVGILVAPLVRRA